MNVLLKLPLSALAVLLLVGNTAACVDAESQFTEGRLEDLCNGVVPVCKARASCVLDPSRYVRSSFPGGNQVLVRSEDPNKKLVVRLFFTDMVFPGTELLVVAHSPDCAGRDEEHIQDVDIFELAGDDVTLEFQLDLPERGDHLLEVFGDLSAGYLLTVDIE